MTALDPAPVIAALREEWAALGQYRPETVRALIATTERTGELPIRPPAWDLLPPDPAPVPRGGRATWPHGRAPRPGAPALALVADLCGERHPTRAVLCGGVVDHADAGLDHVAYGNDGRVIEKWPAGRNRADAR